VSNTYQNKRYRTQPEPQLAGVVVPEQVIVSMAEIAESAKEGLLALAVGAGLQVMAAMFDEDVTGLCGPDGKHNRGCAWYRYGTQGRVGDPGRAALGPAAPGHRAAPGGLRAGPAADPRRRYRPGRRDHRAHLGLGAIPDLFSGKAGYPGTNLQIAATLGGRVAAIGPNPVHGARHDAHAFEASGPKAPRARPRPPPTWVTWAWRASLSCRTGLRPAGTCTRPSRIQPGTQRHPRRSRTRRGLSEKAAATGRRSANKLRCSPPPPGCIVLS
jgi:hypothetical protein